MEKEELTPEQRFIAGILCDAMGLVAETGESKESAARFVIDAATAVTGSYESLVQTADNAWLNKHGINPTFLQ